MKINFTSIESLKEFKGKVLVSVVSQNFVENYVKKNGICECETNCKCGEICLCEKNPLQQAVYDSDFKGKNYQIATVSSSFGKIIFFGVGEADKEKSKLTGYAECRCQSAGHSLFKALKNLKISGKISILYNTLIEKDKITFPKKSEEVLDFAEGFLLSSYEFTKYMSKDKAKDKANPFTEINFITNEKEAAKTFKEREIITNNVFLCRDLINEPANILYPESYTKLI
ncbi:MAG: hypothetical protein LBT02_01805, partial [Rickettsiales bacterium]|nr:hypothetical protein [Rickettsiales bacterium]